MKCLSEQQAAVAEQPIRMIRWPDGPTSSNADSTCRIGRKKADEDQLQPTVRNTLRKLSRPTKKNCPTADRRLEEEGPTKLKDILTFATGSNVVPPIGFSPQPSLEFLHNEGKYPVANTCINCLRLPIHKSYEDFKNNMDFGIQNTQGFGMQ
ncbi:G2/M phase-specific E3 ubiquitin-protein ligase [Anabarilius grahami]|uniref:G2/M phase-specific E3 ubiquitin-protein ligase n=1 Tax=Anabarilius grahami TaxID=495550 RepID=A0A3N0Z9V5_ANAGA|nr:G2/M phase-specific E3 ubiquitin-protein ligase [Anabarilius grahami]